jgi:hypothetical protein
MFPCLGTTTDVTRGCQRSGHTNWQPVTVHGNESHMDKHNFRSSERHNLNILEDQLPPPLLGWYGNDKFNGVHYTRGVKERLPIKRQ